MVRRSANFADLSTEQLGNTLDLLAGRYPSEEFAELRPRVVWNRVTDTVRARDGSKRLAVTSGGTIPDRGLFGVFLPDGKRVGELDEEMVYESRPGETFVLGASTWRIEDITFQRVTVTPAPGEPGKMPFWHGDRPGRPLELGRALGGFVRELRDLDHGAATERLRTEYSLDPLAAANLLQYVDEQAEATGVVPDDRTVVVERFRDEIGDWRVCVLSPFGTPVHAPVGDGDRAAAERSARPARRVDVGRRRHRPAAARARRRAAARRAAHRSGRHRRARRRHPAADGALLVPLPGVCRAGAAPAPPPARPAHPALAATSAGRRPARRGGQVPDVPDPARGDPRVRAGRVRRAGAAGGARAAPQPRRPARQRRHRQAEPDGAEPAVQLDRRLHVRGRRPAGRAAGGGAGARPRPVARSARRRGAARAPRSRRARRRRARPATPVRRSPRPERRRAARCPAHGRRPHRRGDRPALRKPAFCRSGPARCGRFQTTERVLVRIAGGEAGDRGRCRR